MLLRRKQKPNDDEQLVPHVLTWQATEREEVSRSNSGTARFAEFSKLSAKMVELSLQEAQRDPTLRGAVQNKLSAVSSPLLWPSTDIQRIAKPPAESAERPVTAAQNATVAAAAPLNPPQGHGMPRESRIPNFAVLYSRASSIFRETTNYWNEVSRTLAYWLARVRANGSPAVRDLRGYWTSVQKDHQLTTFRARILGRLTIAAQRTELIWQPTALLIGRWSRWVATTAQFLAARVSAKLRILTHSQPLRRLRHACQNNFRVLTARVLAVYTVMKKKFAVWNLTRESPGANSRLWNSMGMAALLALLVLGVISSVHRYATTLDTPKHIDRHTPSDMSPVIPATRGISQPRRSTVAHANGTAASAVVATPASTFASRKRRIHKTRLREDDDYVARDTYIYYGNTGKPMR